MQGLLDFKDGCSFHPSFYCEAVKGKYKPFVSIEEAKHVSVSCNNPNGENIITCLNPYREEFIKEVNGLSFDLQLKTSIAELPSYIPVVDYSSSTVHIPDVFEVIGVTLSDLINQGTRMYAGNLHAVKNFQLRDTLLKRTAFKNKKVILFLTGPDTLIENAWYQRYNNRLFETIGGMGFWAATGFNFSVIGGECSFAQALNLKRSLFSSSLIEQNDIIAIPHVYAISENQLRRWSSWFLRNPSVSLFTINCQLQKKEIDIFQVVHVVNTLLKQFSYLHVLLQGFHMSKLYLFGENSFRVHIADKMPLKYAHAKTLIRHDLQTGRTIETIETKKSLQERIEYNLYERYQFMELQRNRITA